MTDISTWTIVMAAGKTFVGQLRDVDGGLRLEPVFELQAMMQMVQGPRGEPTMAVLRQCFPVLTFSSISSVPLAVGGMLIDVSSLDKDEQRELANAVHGCEQLVLAMRAHRSGVVLAPNGALDKLAKRRQ